MANYNIKLQVDTSQHDAAMKKAAGQVNYYSQRVLDAKEKVAGLAKNVPALAVAVGGLTLALKGVKTVMESVDSLGDDLGRALETGEAVVNSFVTSLATASFSNFIMGLEGVISSAKEAFDSLDKLNTFTLESSIPLADIKAEIAYYRAIIADKNEKKSVREDAQKKLAALEEPLKGIYDSQSKNAMDVFADSLNLILKGILDKDTLEKRGIKTDKIDTEYLLENAVNALRDKTIPGNNESNWQVTMDIMDRYFSDLRAQILTKQQKIIDKHPEGSAQREAAQMYYNKVNRQFDDIFTIIKQGRDASEEDNSLKRKTLYYLQLAIDTNRKRDEDVKIINKASTQALISNDHKSDTPREIIEGSLTDLEYQLKYLEDQKQVAIDLDDAERLRDVLKEIEELQLEISEKKLSLGLTIQNADTKIVQNSLTDLKNQLKLLEDQKRIAIDLDDVDRTKKILKEIEELKNKISEKEIELGIKIKETIDSTSTSTSTSIDTSNDIKTLQNEFYIQLEGITSEALNSSNAFISLGQTISEAFNCEGVTKFFNILQNGLNILNTFFSTYQSIANLIDTVNSHKKTEIALTEAQTAAQAKETTTANLQTTATINQTTATTNQATAVSKEISATNMQSSALEVKTNATNADILTTNIQATSTEAQTAATTNETTATNLQTSATLNQTNATTNQAIATNEDTLATNMQSNALTLQSTTQSTATASTIAQTSAISANTTATTLQTTATALDTATSNADILTTNMETASTVAQTAATTTNTTATTLQTAATVAKTSVTNADILATNMQVTATTAQTAASGAASAANMTEISTEAGKGLTKAVSSSAGVPFPYNLMAIAMSVAAVVSALSMLGSIGKFAEGGVVGGNTTVGDRTLARVNKGEMILNSREQTRLFNIVSGIDSIGTTGTTSGDVKFRISGNDLVGVLNNQNKKKSRAL